MRRGAFWRHAWILSLLALWALIVGLHAWPVAPANDTRGLEISVTPRAIVIADTPLRVFIGSYTGDRAILQFEGGTVPDSVFRDLGRGQLASSTTEIAPEVTTGTTTSGTKTLTLTFQSAVPIGTATYDVVVSGRKYTLNCHWLNA